MSERLRLAFIGCGWWAGTHARALSGETDVEVIALSDTNKDAIRRIKSVAPHLAGAREYTDYVEMLERERLDGVLVLTPHAYHKEQTIAALRRGVNVLVEKPMATSVDEAREILRAAESSGRIVAVAYQRRTDGLFNYIRGKASPAGLGRPLYIEHQLSQDWTRLSSGAWRADPALARGGFLMDSGSHIVDVLLWIMGGLPREVYAVLSSKEGWGAELRASITARFDDCVASISLMGDAPLWSERLRIYCPGGLISYLDELGSKSVWVMDSGAQSLRRPVGELPPSSSPVQNFVRAIRGLERPAAGAEDGLRVALFKDACYRSSASGGPVKLLS
ncbi:MAG: Gfo/Idh/MocA family oxidoreductase [Nitrososphaerota archaeon]